MAVVAGGLRPAKEMSCMPRPALATAGMPAMGPIPPVDGAAVVQLCDARVTGVLDDSQADAHLGIQAANAGRFFRAPVSTPYVHR